MNGYRGDLAEFGKKARHGYDFPHPLYVGGKLKKTQDIGLNGYIEGRQPAPKKKKQNYENYESED